MSYQLLNLYIHVLYLWSYLLPRPKDAQGVVVQDERKEKLRSMFAKLAGADGEIDSEELQDVLTASFSKGTH